MSGLQRLKPTVKAKVQARCAKRGWTLEEFASKASITRPTLWRLLEGRARPTDKTLRGLAKALGLRVGERKTLVVPTEAEDLRARAREMGVEL